MQFFKNRSGISGILFLCLIITSSCATIRHDEIIRSITDAQRSLDIVKKTEARELYPDDFKEAEEKLNRANALSESWFKSQDAYAYALESIEVSKKIMKKLLIGQIRSGVEKVREEVEKKGRDTALKNMIPKLTGVLKYIDSVAENKEDVNVAKFVEIKDESDDAQRRKECTVDGIMKDDVSFNQGKYKIENLPEHGIQVLNQFARKSVEAKNSCLEKVPGSEVVIIISSFGYTDAQPFQEGTKLIEKLEENNKCPQESIERRKCLNQRLSELRAAVIGEYIRKKIAESDSVIRVETGEFIGRGEEIPQGVENPSEDDPRRRICIIESSVRIE